MTNQEIKDYIKKEINTTLEKEIRKEVSKQMTKKEDIEKVVSAVLVKFFKILFTKSAMWSADL